MNRIHVNTTINSDNVSTIQFHIYHETFFMVVAKIHNYFFPPEIENEK